MSEEIKESIKIETTVNEPVKKVWDYFSKPEHIVKWNNASDDWHTPTATNDLKVGGSFLSRMEAKDGSAAFDFKGTYNTVEEHEYIEYVLEDDRIVKITFEEVDGKTKITEVFDTENTHSREMQQAGWQSILDNFKKYTEEN